MYRLTWPAATATDSIAFHRSSVLLDAGRLRLHDAEPFLAPSSRGLGHGPFTAATRVRIPSGSLDFEFLGKLQHPPATPEDVAFCSGGLHGAEHFTAGTTARFYP